MISAPHLAMPGYEAFFVCREGPNYLIQVERRELSRRLARGETLQRIVTGVE
jgi:hypothetical protein